MTFSLATTKSGRAEKWLDSSCDPPKCCADSEKLFLIRRLACVNAIKYR
jgi:hypothetical protein